MAAALTAALSGTATAQTGTPQQTATTPSPSTAAAQTPTAAVGAGQPRSHWLASGFVGSNFATNVENIDLDDSSASFNFGAQVGYLWRGIVGAEALADWAPSMDLTAVAFENSPSVRSYMANAIGTYPLGAEGQFLPYVSGGIGSIRMSADVTPLFIVQPIGFNSDTVSIHSSQSRFGTNIGLGLLAYAGNVGIRTDVRYYHAEDGLNLGDDLTPADVLTDATLAGLAYWRANIGIGFRW
jgi:opacity protein-like surface antigen